MNFGERFKLFSANYCDTLANLSHKMEIGYTQISRYANNKVEPGAAVLTKLAEYGCGTLMAHL